MNEKELTQITEAVREAVEKHVNGKIDRMDKKLDKHLGEMKPFLEGWKGAKILGDLIKWIAGVVAAIGAVYLFFK